jgi:multiple sugar transport system substrate-binding protein
MNWKLLTTLIPCSLLIIGCSTDAPKLTFAVGGAPNEVEYWEKIIDEFTESSKIEVVFLRQPTDTDQRRQGLVIPLKAKKADPDVFLMDVIWIAQFAASDWLLPLTPLIESSNLDTSDFFESVIIQIDQHSGEFVALPVYNDCGILYYRKDLLEEHGFAVPTTWQDLIESAVFIQEKERASNPQFYGFVWQGAQYEGLICNYLEFLVSHNGHILDTAGHLVIANAENIHAVNLMKDIIHEYKISPPNTYTEMKEEEVRLLFETGNALYERNWPYAWGLHARDGSAIKHLVGISILPRSNTGRHAATLGGWHVGISRFSDRKEQALALVEFILSYDVQKRLALELGWNPGRRDLYDDTDINKNVPHIQVLKRSFENAIARPNLPYYTQVSEIMQRHLNAILAGRAEPGNALVRAQEEINNIVQQYHE